MENVYRFRSLNVIIIKKYLIISLYIYTITQANLGSLKFKTNLLDTNKYVEDIEKENKSIRTYVSESVCWLYMTSKCTFCLWKKCKSTSEMLIY